MSEEYFEEAHSPQSMALFVSAFFDELQQLGVCDVVVSPGSRSTPLAMIAYHSSLNVYLDVDERGAAFFALGLAKASTKPVCLICTSGTALANYYPAIMEAESSRVPLMVLSGDRPQHLQSVGAPQTCDQLKAFSNHVKNFWQMPEPYATPKRIAYVRQIACEAYAATAAGTVAAGPVHLNFPFDEPLKPDFEAPGLFLIGRKEKAPTTPVFTPTSVLDFSFAEQLIDYLKSHRVIAICGEGTLGSEVTNKDKRLAARTALEAFAEEFDIPLLVDPLSQMRCTEHEAIIDNYDNFIANDSCPEFDGVIRFGRWPISKRLTTTISQKKPMQITVDPEATRDFTSTTSSFIKMEPVDFIASLLAIADLLAEEQIDGNSAQTGDAKQGNVKQELDSLNADNSWVSSGSFVAEWSQLNDEARFHIEQVSVHNDSSFEGRYISALLDNLPEESLLFSANSMSVRAIDTFYVKQDKYVSILANRGLNGIDGTLSTAFGAAQYFSQTVCLTGDLTMIHDLNSLALQNEMRIRKENGAFCPPIVVVLLNNAGGAIFDMLPQRKDNPYFERLFLTPQKVNFEACAAGFFVPYRKALSVEEFEQALNEFLGEEGIHLIEIPVPLQGVTERYKPYQS